MATVTMNTEAAIVVVYDYCYEGIWASNDELHNCPSPCGRITYIDAYGNTETISGISTDDPTITIKAQSIVSTIGVKEVVCQI
ncbi:MAG TPA: hypothetical protein PKI46_09670, partial [Bacteroidales bacterium]|nr:hypothetical protein [Bacteroidales bacterium]